MKQTSILALILFSLAALSYADSPRASMKLAPDVKSSEYQATLADIKGTLGSIPSFLASSILSKQ